MASHPSKLFNDSSFDDRYKEFRSSQHPLSIPSKESQAKLAALTDHDSNELHSFTADLLDMASEIDPLHYHTPALPPLMDASQRIIRFATSVASDEDTFVDNSTANLSDTNDEIHISYTSTLPNGQSIAARPFAPGKFMAANGDVYMRPQAADIGSDDDDDEGEQGLGYGRTVRGGAGESPREEDVNPANSRSVCYSVAAGASATVDSDDEEDIDELTALHRKYVHVPSTTPVKPSLPPVRVRWGGAINADDSDKARARNSRCISVNTSDRYSLLSLALLVLGTAALVPGLYMRAQSPAPYAPLMMLHLCPVDESAPTLAPVEAETDLAGDAVSASQADALSEFGFASSLAGPAPTQSSVSWGGSLFATSAADCDHSYFPYTRAHASPVSGRVSPQSLYFSVPQSLLARDVEWVPYLALSRGTVAEVDMEVRELVPAEHSHSGKGALARYGASVARAAGRIAGTVADVTKRAVHRTRNALSRSKTAVTNTPAPTQPPSMDSPHEHALLEQHSATAPRLRAIKLLSASVRVDTGDYEGYDPQLDFHAASAAKGLGGHYLHNKLAVEARSRLSVHTLRSEALPVAGDASTSSHSTTGKDTPSAAISTIHASGARTSLSSDVSGKGNGATVATASAVAAASGAKAAGKANVNEDVKTDVKVDVEADTEGSASAMGTLLAHTRHADLSALASESQEQVKSTTPLSTAVLALLPAALEQPSARATGPSMGMGGIMAVPASALTLSDKDREKKEAALRADAVTRAREACLSPAKGCEVVVQAPMHEFVLDKTPFKTEHDKSQCHADTPSGDADEDTFLSRAPNLGDGMSLLQVKISASVRQMPIQSEKTFFTETTQSKPTEPVILLGFHQASLAPGQARGVVQIIVGLAMILVGFALAYIRPTIKGDQRGL